MPKNSGRISHLLFIHHSIFATNNTLISPHSKEIYKQSILLPTCQKCLKQCFLNIQRPIYIRTYEQDSLWAIPFYTQHTVIQLEKNVHQNHWFELTILHDSHNCLTKTVLHVVTKFRITSKPTFARKLIEIIKRFTFIIIINIKNISLVKFLRLIMHSAFTTRKEDK